MGICFACAAYAYRVNARREEGDPEKREFEFGAVFLAALSWVVLIPASIAVAVIRAFLGMVFIVLFAVGVLAVRKNFILKWLDKVMVKIGNKLLAANTILLRAFLGKPIRQSK
jgi:hypothetical protein